MYNDPSSDNFYKEVIDGAHLLAPFQCDVYVFLTPSNKYLRGRYMEILKTWWLSVKWTWMHIININNIIITCEYYGFYPQLSSIGPLPLEDLVELFQTQMEQFT